MEMEDQLDVNFEPKMERPTFLKVLSILSFISIGLSLLSGVYSLITGPLSDEQMLEQKVELLKSTDELRSAGMDGFVKLLEQIQRMSESINQHFYAVSLVSILVLGIGLFGVLKMWMGKRIGFHLYIIYSLLTVGQLYLFVASADVPSVVVIWNLVIAALFIFMYSRNLKWMK
jgi:TM2 domain-containing membrane protein YozV